MIALSTSSPTALIIHPPQHTPHLLCAPSEVLASRGDDGSVRLWDIAGQLSQAPRLQEPLKVIPNLMNLYPSANVAFR